MFPPCRTASSHSTVFRRCQPMQVNIGKQGHSSQTSPTKGPGGAVRGLEQELQEAAWALIAPGPHASPVCYNSAGAPGQCPPALMRFSLLPCPAARARTDQAAAPCPMPACACVRHISRPHQMPMPASCTIWQQDPSPHSSPLAWRVFRSCSTAACEAHEELAGFSAGPAGVLVFCCCQCVDCRHNSPDQMYLQASRLARTPIEHGMIPELPISHPFHMKIVTVIPGDASFHSSS